MWNKQCNAVFRLSSSATEPAHNTQIIVTPPIFVVSFHRLTAPFYCEMADSVSIVLARLLVKSCLLFVVCMKNEFFVVVKEILVRTVVNL